jgi:hypothetical protein
MVRMRKHLALKRAVTEARDYARLTRNRRKRSKRQLQRLSKKLNIVDHTLEPNTNAGAFMNLQQVFDNSFPCIGDVEPPSINDPPFDPDTFADPQAVVNNSLQTHNIVLHSQTSHDQCNCNKREHSTKVPSKNECIHTSPDNRSSTNVTSEGGISGRTRSRTHSSNNSPDQTSTNDDCSVDIMSHEDNSDITPSELKAELKNCGEHKVRKNSDCAPLIRLEMDLFLIAAIVTFSGIIAAVCRKNVCAVFENWFKLCGHKLGLAPFCNYSKSTSTSQQNG